MAEGQLQEPILGASSDVVLYPDGATVIDRRFGSCNLLWRGVIHRGTRKASSVGRGVHIGSQDQGKRRFDGIDPRPGKRRLPTR